MVYRSRIRDWLHGVCQIQPVKETVETLTQAPLSEAERLRIIYDLMTCQDADGGANITPKHGDWKNVEAIFSLHNHTRNKDWLAEFSKKTFLTPEDLDHIRNAVGEKVWLYRVLIDGPLTKHTDRILLCLPPVLLPIPDVPSCLRCFGLGPTWKLLSCLHDRNWHVVRCVR